MTVRAIQGHLLEELYGLQVTPNLISTITDEVLVEVEQWQQRPLEPTYTIVYFDVLRLKIRDEGTVHNNAVYLALGIRGDGRKEVLSPWIEQTGRKYQVITVRYYRCDKILSSSRLAPVWNYA